MTQDFDSGEATSAKSTASGRLTGLTPGERQARAREAFDRRLIELKSKLPPRSTALVEAIPVKHRGMHAKALLKECSPAAAIKAKCHDCVGWEDVQKAIGGCSSYACPLWQWRPYRDSPEKV